MLYGDLSLIVWEALFVKKKIPHYWIKYVIVLFFLWGFLALVPALYEINIHSDLLTNVWQEVTCSQLFYCPAMRDASYPVHDSLGVWRFQFQESVRISYHTAV